VPMVVSSPLTLVTYAFIVETGCTFHFLVWQPGDGINVNKWSPLDRALE